MPNPDDSRRLAEAGVSRMEGRGGPTIHTTRSGLGCDRPRSATPHLRVTIRRPGPRRARGGTRLHRQSRFSAGHPSYRPGRPRPPLERPGGPGYDAPRQTSMDSHSTVCRDWSGRPRREIAPAYSTVESKPARVVWRREVTVCSAARSAGPGRRSSLFRRLS